MGGVSVKFYDKVAEVKKKKKLPKCMTIPPYLLRYELTLHSKMLKEIFKDGLTARDLWNKKSFQNLLRKNTKISFAFPIFVVIL